jgi:hypothetical protein
MSFHYTSPDKKVQFNINTGNGPVHTGKGKITQTFINVVPNDVAGENSFGSFFNNDFFNQSKSKKITVVSKDNTKPVVNSKGGVMFGGTGDMYITKTTTHYDSDSE